MDNAQNKQFGNSSFTPGVGEIPVEQNMEEIPSLNLGQSVWQSEHNSREIGNLANRAISSTENSNAMAYDNLPMPPMGEIVPIEAPAQSESSDRAASFNRTTILTVDGHLTGAAIDEIHRAESELSQTGNIANFYDEIRSMMEGNLENSYHRKLAP